MEQITAMKITGLGLRNFRNHTEPQYFEFGDYSFVSGHNGSGKTTTAHGICYALYGVSYYGEQKIERLMNENACELQVQLDFIDQNGKAHSLIRSRKNDKNSLLMDGYTIRQGDVERIFCERDVFLAMFNPTYLTERLTGNEGRELILKFLSPVEPQTVLEQIGTFAEALAGIDLTTASPEQLLEDYRKAIRQAEKQLDAVKGNIDAVEEMITSAGKQLGNLYTERRNTESAIAALKGKQFDGLDPDELAIQRDALITQLAACSGKEDPRITELRAKMEQVRQRVYVSKYTQALAEAQAEAKMLSEKYAKLAQTYKALKPGVKCPTCTTLVTEENLAQMQASMMAELTALREKGQAVVERGKEIAELDKKSRETFEQFRQDDLAKLQAELDGLLQTVNSVSAISVQERLDELDDLLKYGRLSESEYTELTAMEATLVGVNAQIQSIEQQADEDRLNAAKEQRTVYEQQITTYRNVVAALTEYIFKRTELATAELTMPNVTLHLFDVFRTTGEVKSVFKFDYKGREYTTLSLSEKTRAGIEIAAMLRRITGIDCPICIDNTESIASFNLGDMPSQAILLRFVKGQTLKVEVKNKLQVLPTQEELRKAS